MYSHTKFVQMSALLCEVYMRKKQKKNIGIRGLTSKRREIQQMVEMNG